MLVQCGHGPARRVRSAARRAPARERAGLRQRWRASPASGSVAEPPSMNKRPVRSRAAAAGRPAPKRSPQPRAPSRASRSTGAPPKTRWRAFEQRADRAAIRAITLGHRALVSAARCRRSNRCCERPDGLRRKCARCSSAARIRSSTRAIPPHSTVDAAVDAARILKQERAAGLVNAVLRRFAREKDALLAQGGPATRYAHRASAVARRAASRRPGRITSSRFSTRTTRIRRWSCASIRRARSVADYIAELAPRGSRDERSPWAPAAVQLEQPVPVIALPGFRRRARFRAGRRRAARRAAARCRARHARARCLRGARRQDGSPAGAHPRPRRAGRRGHRRAAPRPGAGEPRPAAAARPPWSSPTSANPRRFWDQRPFDRILAGCPVLLDRRDPAPPGHQAAAARRRTSRPWQPPSCGILQACFRMLAPGGRLLYSTCSRPAGGERGRAGRASCASERRARVVPVTLAAAGARRPGARGRGAVAARDGGGHRWLPLCLCRKDN